MTEKELRSKIEDIRTILKNAENALGSTFIPPYAIISYIKDETGLDIEKMK